MKIIITLIALIQVQASLASLPNYIVSHHDFVPYPGTTIQQMPIYEGKNSHLLVRLSPCFPPNIDPKHPDIIINGNEIKILNRLQSASNKCTPPPPPSYFNYAELPALATGNYHLSLYLIPSDVEYPPNNTDLPNYLHHELDFEVFAVESVDTLSVWSLGLLILALLILGLSVFKKQDIRKILY